MKDLIREAELEAIYHKIMARENLEVFAPLGSGKSYLCEALKDRLRGRRVCLHIEFGGLYDLKGLVIRLDAALVQAEQNHQNLAFQLRRFREEHPLYRLEDIEDLKSYLQELRDQFSQVGLDFLFIFENPEYWELDSVVMDLLKSLVKLSQSPNSQILLVSENAWQVFPPFPLRVLEANDIWEKPNENQIALLDYCRSNLSFLKKWQNTEVATGSKTAAFFKTYSPIFRSLRRRFTPLQWKLLRSIAKYEQVAQPHAFKFLVKHQLGAASSVERALRNLSDSGFLERREEGYRLVDPLLHRWLQWIYYQQKLD